MGWYVHIHVCFPCQHNEPVAALAQKHLHGISDDGDGERAAIWFLEALAKRTGDNPGPKGGLSLWGMVGNYTNGRAFVDRLCPFWEELLRKEVGGISDHEHIVVFVEPEQSEAAQAYEIGLDREWDATPESGKLVVKHHEGLPFSFMQMRLCKST